MNSTRYEADGAAVPLEGWQGLDRVRLREMYDPNVTTDAIRLGVELLRDLRAC